MYLPYTIKWRDDCNKQSALSAKLNGRINYMSSILSFLAKREPDGRRTAD
jgi:hypothetical protein